MQNKEQIKNIYKSDIVDSLNRLYNKEYFLLSLAKCYHGKDEDNKDVWVTIGAILFIPTGQTIISLKQYMYTDDDVYEDILKELNLTIIKELIWRKPTNGLVEDMHGIPIKTLVDCLIDINLKQVNYGE